MNDKEKLFYHVVETAARCCSYTLKDGMQSITVADVLWKSMMENVYMTRNIAVENSFSLNKGCKLFTS